MSSNQLTSIQPFSFQHNVNLKTFIMSDSPNLKRIHKDAFSPNLKLENVTMSGNFELEEIENNAFNRNVSALASLDLSNNRLR